MASTEAQKIFGVSGTTLDKWRAKGAPHTRSGRKVFYDIPRLIEWRVEREREAASVPSAAIEKAAEDGDRELALGSLRELAKTGSPIARVQAAKALLGMADSGDIDTSDEIVSFIEIENRGGKIVLNGAEQIPCPECGAMVRFGGRD